MANVILLIVSWLTFVVGQGTLPKKADAGVYAKKAGIAFDLKSNDKRVVAAVNKYMSESKG